MSKKATAEKPKEEYVYDGDARDEVAEIEMPDINVAAEEAFSEELPDLEEFTDEPSTGAWAPGWYKAEVLEGYSTARGKQIVTEDNLSQNGDSHNLNVALKITDGTKDRNIRLNLNYRVEDFTPARMDAIKEARKEFAGMRGKWPGEAGDLQRSSLAVAKIGQLQRAVGLKMRRTADGILVPTTFVGHSLDVRLKIDSNGYNEVVEFAKSGERTSVARGTRR